MENSPTDEQTVRQIAAALKREPEIETPDCLSPERMIALAEGDVADAEATGLMAHVSLCTRCRREYAETVELLELAKELPVMETPAVDTVNTVDTAVPIATPTVSTPTTRPSFWQQWQRWLSPTLGFSLGAAAAAGLLLVTLTAPARQENERLTAALNARQAQVAEQEKQAKSLEAKLNTLQQQKQGDTARLTQKVTRLEAQAKTQRLQVARLMASEATLQQMPLPVPDWEAPKVDYRTRGAETGSETPRLRLRRPVNIGLQDTTPILEAETISGATTYTLSLEQDGSNNEIPTPRKIGPARWQVTTPLQPGTRYQWAVTAERGGNAEPLRSPLSSFYVLSAAERQEIEAAKSKYKTAPLTLAAVYSRLGLWDEASEQIEAVLKATPNHPVAKRWQAELRARRSTTITS